MKLQKIMIVLLIPIIAEIVIACCDCLETVTKNYTNKTMSVDNIDNSGQQPIVTFSSSIPKNAYGIKVSFHREITACIKKPTVGFFPPTYATSCECPPTLAIMPNDSIIAIKVFSVYAFDHSHPAGSDISEYFKIHNDFSFLSITDYLQPHIHRYYGYSNWVLHDESELESEFILLLMTNPKNHTANKFKIQIALSDGRVLEQETNEINFV